MADMTEATGQRLAIAMEELAASGGGAYGSGNNDQSSVSNAAGRNRTPPSGPNFADEKFTELYTQIGNTAGVKQLLAAGETIDGFVDNEMLARMQRLQDQFGGIAGEAGNAFREADGMAGQYRDAMLRFNEGLTGNTTDFNDSVSGLNVSFRSLVGDAKTATAAFDRMTIGARGSADGYRFLQNATEDTIRDMAIFGQQMNMNEREISTFMTREISLGKEAGSMLQEAAVYSTRVAAITGDSAKEIMDSIEAIISDTQRYGNVSVAEAAKIGTTLRQLGLDYSELGGMTDKYFDFESAASSVSALTSVFGVNIDAMEAMRLANSPDRLDFLTYMRDSFMESGKAVEDMTLAEKRLVQQQLGLSSIESVERLFDPTVDLDSLDAIDAATQEGVGTFEESITELETQIRQFGQGTTGALDRLRQASSDAFEAGMQEDLLATTTQLNEVEGAVDRTAQALGRIATTDPTIGLQNQAANLDSIMESVGQHQESLLGGFILAFEGDGSDENPGIIGAFANALSEAFEALLEPPWRQQSPSVAGLMMTGGIIKAFEKLPQSATKEFRKAGIAGDKAFTKSLSGMKGFKDIASLGITSADMSKKDLKELADQFEVDTGRMKKALDSTAKNVKERDKAQDIEAHLRGVMKSGYDEKGLNNRLESLSKKYKVSMASMRGFVTGNEDQDFIFKDIMANKKKALAENEKKKREEKEGSKVEKPKAKKSTDEATRQLEEAKKAQVVAESDAAEARKKLGEALSNPGAISIKIEQSDVIVKLDQKVVATAAIDGFVAGATDSGGKAVKVELTT